MRFVRLFAVLAALLAVGEIAADAAPDVLVNVANPGFESGAEGWNLPPGYSVVSDVAHTGSKSLRLVNIDPKVYVLGQQTLDIKPGTPYQFGVWVKTKEVAGEETGATFCIEYWDSKGGYLGGIYPTGAKGDTDWTQITGVVQSVPPHASRITLSLYLRRGMTGTAWFDDVTVTPFFDMPLDCALVKPVYRATLEENARDQLVLVLAKVATLLEDGSKPSQCRLECRVMSGDKVILKASRRSKAGINQLSLNVRRIPVGDYTVRVSLSSPSGKELATRNLELHKTAAGAAKPTVYIDSYGRCIRNGKPFFPLGLYFGPGPDRTGSFREHIDRVAKGGFNTIMPYSINVDSLPVIREYLDYLQLQHVSILYSLKDIQKGIAYYQENLLDLGDEDGQITGLVSAFKDHPALLGWYLNDEAPLTFQDRLIARYKQVKNFDPNHPTWSVLNDPGTMFGYLETCDVLGADPYPIEAGTVETAGNWTEATVGASLGNKPVWMVPQAFNWGVYGETAAQKAHRAPTLDEMMVMSYLCLIKGAKGLIYYSYFDMQRDPLGFDSRWKDMTAVSTEMQKLAPMVLSIARTPDVKLESSSKSLYKLAKSDDQGKVYVMLANTDKTKPAVVTIIVPNRRRAQLLEEGATSDITRRVQDGKLTITLMPIQAATVVFGD